MRRAVLAFLIAVAGLVVAPAPSALAADAGDRLYADEYLDVGDTLTSPNGSYILLVQSDGNVVIYSRAWQPVWSTGTSGTDNWLLFDAYDGLEVYSSTDQLLWRAGPPNMYMTHVGLQDDGNLVMFNVADGRPAWSRTTGPITSVPPRPAPAAPTYRGDRIGPGGGLTTNQFLAVGGWSAVLQADGNFVVYANGVAQWNTRTGFRSPIDTTLVMQADGNAVLYSYLRAEWSSGTSGGPSTMILQTDGNLVVYGADGRARWSRTTGPIR